MDRVQVDILERLQHLSWDAIVAALRAHYGGLTWAFVRDVLTDYGVFLVIALGLYVLMCAGQVSLGHAGLVGIAAYSAAVMSVKLGIPFWLGLVMSGEVGLVAGLAYSGLVALRLGGFYLAMGTFAVGEMLISIWLNSEYLGGAIGFVGIPLMSHWPVVLTVLVLTLFAVWRLERSRFWPAFCAIRDNEVVAGA